MRGLALLAWLLAMPAEGAPRVVSLNLCTDQFLILLAPERATALSPLARDPALSVVARQAAAMPWVRPDAEAVLALHPDLVLAVVPGVHYPAIPNWPDVGTFEIPIDLHVEDEFTLGSWGNWPGQAAQYFWLVDRNGGTERVER